LIWKSLPKEQNDLKKDAKSELKNVARNGLTIAFVKKNVFGLKKRLLLARPKKIELKLNVKLKWIANVR